MMKQLRFISDERGSILVETALVLPILVLIFVGMVEFSEAFMVKRKAGAVASATADLVAQASRVSAADLADISSIANNLMQPYPAGPLIVLVECVTADANGNPLVTWSWSSPASAAKPKAGDPYPLPDGLIGANESIIVTQTSYTFTPPIAQFLTDGVQFNSTAYFKPRLSPTVQLQ